MKSVRIRSYSGPHFFRIFPHSDWIRRHTPCIQSECGKNVDQNNSEYGHFLRSVNLCEITPENRQAFFDLNIFWKTYPIKLLPLPHACCECLHLYLKKARQEIFIVQLSYLKCYHHPLSFTVCTHWNWKCRQDYITRRLDYF